MKKEAAITCVLLDIGGVLLTDGWGHKSRKLAAKVFDLNHEDLETRHNQAFDTYELGKLTLEEYLNWVVFHQTRPFTRAQFRKFMFAQSAPHPQMIDLFRQLKTQYGLKIVVVSNEARELNSHRIQKFKLDGFIDAFISSCFVHLRKPDFDIFKMAMDIAQTPPQQVVYVENTAVQHPEAESGGPGSRVHDHQHHERGCIKLKGK